jgi:hypothetical protein
LLFAGGKKICWAAARRWNSDRRARVAQAESDLLAAARRLTIPAR